ncbi:predicted protein [Streptomyces sp. C]|nr:predicted protein [Streptomyces sp. C]
MTAVCRRPSPHPHMQAVTVRVEVPGVVITYRAQLCGSRQDKVRHRLVLSMGRSAAGHASQHGGARAREC